MSFAFIDTPSRARSYLKKRFYHVLKQNILLVPPSYGGCRKMPLSLAVNHVPRVFFFSFFERMSPARWYRVFLLFSRRKLRGSHFSSASEKKVFTSYLLKRLVVSSAFRSFSKHLVCDSKLEDNKNLPEQYLGGMSPRRSPLVRFGL